MSSHAESIPRGAYAPRSCFAMRTSADEKTIFAIHIRTSGQERRASARRGNETHLQDGSLCVRRTTPPAAAGVSPSWFENRTCADNSVDIYTRGSHAAPRAAGVSPPWVCKPSPQRQCGEFRRLEPARRIHPTGGLRTPLLFRDAHVCRRKNDFCDTHTHIRSRAAGVSPPWKRNALAGRFALRSANNGSRAAGVSPPWFDNRTCEDNSAQHPHTTVTRSTKSGGRQPAECLACRVMGNGERERRRTR
jgi:hypothetical protein